MLLKLESRWLLCALLATLSWGLWAFLPKIALQTLPPGDLIFYESFGNLIPAVAIFIFMRGRIRMNVPGIRLIILGSLAAFGSILAYLYALDQGKVAVVVTVTAMYPVVTILLAWAILKEKITPRQCAAIILALIAIYLLAG